MAARHADRIVPDRAVRETNRNGGAEVLSTETIDCIKHFHGSELPVVSIYVAVNADAGARKGTRTKVDSLLHAIRPQTEDHSVAHAVRLSLRHDIERVEELVRNEASGPEPS